MNTEFWVAKCEEQEKEIERLKRCQVVTDESWRKLADENATLKQQLQEARDENKRLAESDKDWEIRASDRLERLEKAEAKLQEVERERDEWKYCNEAQERKTEATLVGFKQATQRAERYLKALGEVKQIASSMIPAGESLTPYGKIYRIARQAIKEGDK